jgi:pyruvate/2-oxoglutarate dehydrogenase complex dihydrolipoamide acyltransferase (E2) component
MIRRRFESQRPENSDGASWQDDIDVRPAASPSGTFKVFSVLGALFFALVGAGVYAMTGWPWQGTGPGPAVAVPAQNQTLARADLQLRDAPALMRAPDPRPMPQTPEPAPAAMPAPAPAAAPPQPQLAALPSPAPAPEPAPAQPSSPPVATPLAAALPRQLTIEEQAEVRQFVQRAQQIIERTSDIAAARLFLERAVRLGDGDAAFRLAETFDPSWLTRIGARGVAGDPARARGLYQQALDRGVAAARERLAALR